MQVRCGKALVYCVALAGFASTADAKYLVCHPGIPSFEWNETRWTDTSYRGELVRVMLSNFGMGISLHCVRAAGGEVIASNIGNCRFAEGTLTTKSNHKGFETITCLLRQQLNDSECVVRCDE